MNVEIIDINSKELKV